MIENIEIKRANFSCNMLSENEDISGFLKDINNIAKGYYFTGNNSGVTLLSICVVANAPKITAKPIFSEKGFNIVEFNNPTILSGNQDIENKKIIDRFSKLKSIVCSLEIDNIFILILYNKSFDNVKINGLERILESSESNKSNSSSDMFSSVEPKFSMDQVVLNDSLKLEIEKTLIILEHKNIIYEEWGFNLIEKQPKAIINFYGAPGTGKTMTAHAIANRLECKIVSVNYADIESKYVGDAPKNLLGAFNSAKNQNALLFFDEADSFLGKRISNISSSSDQAINSLRSQMLILLDDFEGVIIFATNLIKNYDKAFESRIFKHLKFELPCFDIRKDIINKSIPLLVPISDRENPLCESDLEELSVLSDGFSGRHIKTAVLDGLTNALLNKRKHVKFNDFILSFNNKKNEIELLNNERGEISNVRKNILSTIIKNNLDKEK